MIFIQTSLLPLLACSKAEINLKFKVETGLFSLFCTSHSCLQIDKYIDGNYELSALEIYSSSHTYTENSLVLH